MTVKRFDNARISKKSLTPQGFLKIPARLTRVGILEYRRSDGSVQKELRLPEEVFSPVSLATLAQAPVTELHPDQMVNPSNVRALSIGVSSETPKQDGIFVASDLTVMDAGAIASVEKGDLKEISCGYFCSLDMSPGVYQGEKYDAIQRNIRYNHVALGPDGWGRAGSDVSLRLDSQDGVANFDSATSDIVDTEKNEDTSIMDEIEIKLDGKIVKVKADVVQKELDRRDAKISELETKLGTSEAKATDLSTKLGAANDPRAVQAKVDARIGLESAARKVLGDAEKLDGLSTRQIHEKVICKVKPESKFDGLSNDRVLGMFEYATSVPAEKKNDSLEAARKAAEEAAAKGRKDAKSARDEAIAKKQGLWKGTK